MLQTDHNHSITLLVLTKNEELHVSRLFDNVKSLVRRIVIVDSYSSDRTLDLAREANAYIVQRSFVSHSDQLNWALKNIEFDTDWIIRLDADEILEENLIEELQETLGKLDKDVNGIKIKRKHIFQGRWLRFGGRFPITLLRIWRTGTAHVESRWMDEHILVKGGRVICAKGRFQDWNLNDLTYFVSKHNDYATREAVETVCRKYNLSDQGPSLRLDSGQFSAYVKRFIKSRFYYALPYEIASILYFLWRYIFLLGFLDGRAGLTYHILQGFWYRYLVGAKVRELISCLRCVRASEDRSAIIFKLTGLKISRQ